MKKCNKCGEVKPLNEFHNDNNKKDGKCTLCAECKKRTTAKHRLEKPEYMKEWRSKNKKRVHEYNVWHYRNNFEYFKEKSARFLKENPERARAYSNKRRAHKERAIPNWFEQSLVQTVYKKAVELGMTVDHIVPINSKAVCGLHCWANLQLLDNGLNCSKGNRHWPDMWDEHERTS